jgi:hypothetical protein
MSAVSITLPTIQASTYTPYDFITMVNFQGNIYGVKADGIYQINGDTDNGDAITCTVETGIAQFQDTNGGATNKRIRPESMMYYGISSSVGAINLIGDDSTHSYVPPHVATREKNRCRFARGRTGFYWHIEMIGAAPFEIYQLDMVAYDTGRMI